MGGAINRVGCFVAPASPALLQVPFARGFATRNTVCAVRRRRASHIAQDHRDAIDDAREPFKTLTCDKPVGQLSNFCARAQLPPPAARAATHTAHGGAREGERGVGLCICRCLALL